MKLFRKGKCSRDFLIAGVVQMLLGFVMLHFYYSITIPEDYALNAIDVIFIVPMLAKLIFYESLQILAEALLNVGWIQIGVGGGCFLLGIPAIPDIVHSIRNYTGYFKKGSTPTEQELHDMLESGEMTKREYDEIRSYMDNKKR